MILFGGTFDPIHNGHIQLATKLYRTFNQQVIFIPNNQASYKCLTNTTVMQRVEMLELAIKEHKEFGIDLLEAYQAKYCPTYITLELIRKKIPKEHSLIFCIGSDSLLSLDSWDNWLNLFTLTHFVVIRRPGFEFVNMNSLLKREFQQRLTKNYEDLIATASGKIFLLDMIPMDISSTQIRNLIKDRRDICQLVPSNVKEYIHKHKLYIK